METKWYQRLGIRSKRDSKSSVQIDDQLLDLMCYRMQKSFDKSVDKLLKRLMEYHLTGDFYNRSGGMADDEKRKVFRQKLTSKLLNNYIKNSKKKKEKIKTILMDPRYQEIVEYCTMGNYRLLSGESWAKPNIFQELPDRPQQIFWDISKVTESVKFTYESEANKIFGLKHKRLIQLHPHLIHYILDKEDCYWLRSVGMLKDNMKKWRLSILLFDQLRELRENDKNYRIYCSDINFTKLRAFKLPKFMLKKIRFYIIRLQIKTNGKITIVEPLKNENQSAMQPSSDNNSSIKLQTDQGNKLKASKIPKFLTNYSHSKSSSESIKPVNSLNLKSLQIPLDNNKGASKSSLSRISSEANKPNFLKLNSLQNPLDTYTIRSISSLGKNTLEANKQNSLKSKCLQNPHNNNRGQFKSSSQETLTPWYTKFLENRSQEKIYSSLNKFKLQINNNSKFSESNVTISPQMQTLHENAITHSSNSYLNIKSNAKEKCQCHRSLYTPPVGDVRRCCKSCCCCCYKASTSSAQQDLTKNPRFLSRVHCNASPSKCSSCSVFPFKYPSLHTILKNKQNFWRQDEEILEEIHTLN